MRKATAILMSVLFTASLAGCDTKTSSDTWRLTSQGVLLLKAGERDPIRISLPDWIWAGEPYTCGPALAVGPKGEAVVTSDVVPVVWRVDPASLQVTRHAVELDRDTGKDVGFSTLSYSTEQGAFIAINGLDGSLWMIDAQLTKAKRIGRPDGQGARVSAMKARAQLCTARFAGLSLDN